ncbi:putative folate/biopterin transporter [Leptomonas pyrrhocoris]|uniref:Putative folate/biopterin transporter n=1 Tax=Leptomonas pyrrhocoris TaxID=157538 RepID=A0A0M9FTT0_LEPPY|nr:putative folate/biopterin transporter [Leptomonas pyrrhocoris]KPA75940.1 putative folate/biopterin transporter [Leptomonas pyrrhocoris]|eukprot:XP_015654379.1 putative folate/biopterin transporter [Leptomonas pyrrhocoris]
MEYGWSAFAENDKCNYENLPWLLFTVGVCIPLLVIPLSFLLPRVRIIDDVDIDGNVVRAQVDKKVVAEEVLTESSTEEPINHPEKREA